MGSTHLSPAPVFQILYLSHLADGQDFSVVKDIVRASRACNPARGITGALLFDGERFGNLLEGNEREVVPLMRHIERDARHAGIRKLHTGPASRRALASWRSGYCESASDLDRFEGTDGPTGAEAVLAFVALAQAADLD
jgi:hypothetical protein